MTDNNKPETVTIETAMEAVDMAVADTVADMMGPSEFDRTEIQRQHLEAIARAERMGHGDHQDVLALLPRTIGEAHSQLLAGAAVLLHVAKLAGGDEWPDLLAQARADLLGSDR